MGLVAAGVAAVLPALLLPAQAAQAVQASVGRKPLIVRLLDLAAEVEEARAVGLVRKRSQVAMQAIMVVVEVVAARVLVEQDMFLGALAATVPTVSL
jgi:hypothetical protein